jgi:hypothetical protein
MLPMFILCTSRGSGIAWSLEFFSLVYLFLDDLDRSVGVWLRLFSIKNDDYIYNMRGATAKNTG